MFASILICDFQGTRQDLTLRTAHSLMAELGTRCRHLCRLKSDPDSPAFFQDALPTPLQIRALELIRLFPVPGNYKRLIFHFIQQDMPDLLRELRARDRQGVTCPYFGLSLSPARTSTRIKDSLFANGLNGRDFYI